MPVKVLKIQSFSLFPLLVLISFSFGDSHSESRSVMSDSLRPHGLYGSWNSPGQSTGMGRLSLLQGIFPTQGSNPGLPHHRRILYQLSHKRSPCGPELAFNRNKLIGAGAQGGMDCSKKPHFLEFAPTESVLKQTHVILNSSFTIC